MEPVDAEPMPAAARVPSFMLTPTFGYGLVASAVIMAALIGMIPGALLVLPIGWGDVDVPLLLGSSAVLVALLAGVAGAAWGVSRLQVTRPRPMIVAALVAFSLLLAAWIAYLMISSAALRSGHLG